ncbi:MAG: hypothetical protein ACKVUT_17445 [Gaiella sp.]
MSKSPRDDAPERRPTQTAHADIETDAEADEEAAVDETADQSFPASDPPSRWAGKDTPPA